MIHRTWNRRRKYSTVLKFEDIKGYHDSGFWNAAMVKNAVKKKRITAEEYTEITGKEYQ